MFLILLLYLISNIFINFIKATLEDSLLAYLPLIKDTKDHYNYNNAEYLNGQFTNNGLFTNVSIELFTLSNKLFLTNTGAICFWAYIDNLPTLQDYYYYYFIQDVDYYLTLWVTTDNNYYPEGSGISSRIQDIADGSNYAQFSTVENIGDPYTTTIFNGLNNYCLTWNTTNLNEKIYFYLNTSLIGASYGTNTFNITSTRDVVIGGHNGQINCCELDINITYSDLLLYNKTLTQQDISLIFQKEYSSLNKHSSSNKNIKLNNIFVFVIIFSTFLYI